jgi:3-oxoadipate enol-lactonase
MPLAQLADAQIYYEWAGPEGAPVLLFSNGLGTTIKMWEPQVDAFAREFRILRYDSRGHGQSSIPAGPYTIAQMGGDAIQLLDTFKVERAYFCGLSMGGMVGMHLGTREAARFYKIVLCDTAAQIGTMESWDARIQMVQKEGMKAVARIVIERWFTEKYRASHPNEVATAQRMLEESDPAGYASGCAAVRDADFREELRSFSGATLVLTGSFDGVSTPADGKYLARNIPGARFVEIPGAHLSNIEARDDFSREVLEFFRA